MSTENKFMYNIIQLLSIISLSFIIVLLVKPTINNIQKKIEVEKIRMVHELENRYEIKISYGSISPLIVDSIIINDISIISNNLEHSAFIQTAVIKFSLINLIKFSLNKVDPPPIIPSINLRRGKVTLNISDPWLIGRSKSKNIKNSVFNTKLYLKDIDVTLNTETLSIEIENTQGTLKTKLKRYLVNLKAKVIYTRKYDQPFKYISGSAEISGYLENNFIDLATKVKLRDIESDYGKLDDLEANLTLENKELRIVNRDKYSKLDYWFLYKINRDELFFNADTDNLKVSSIFKPTKTSEIVKSIYDSNLSLNVRGSYNIKDKRFIYSSNGSAVVRNLPNNIDFNSNFSIIGDLDYITFRKLNINSNMGNIGFYGGVDLNNYFPSGKAYCSDIKISDQIKLNSSVSIEVVNNKFISAKFDYVEGAGIKLDDISSVFYVDDKDISFKAINLDENEKISLSGNYNKIEKNFKSSISIYNYNLNLLNELYSLNNKIEFLNNNKLTLIGDINYQNSNFRYTLKKLQLKNSNNGLLLEAKGLGSKNSFNIDNISLTIPGVDLEGRIDGKTVDGTLNVSVDTIINDNKYKFGIVADGQTINAKGSYGFDLNLDLGETKYINLTMDNFPISYNDWKLNTSLKLKSALFGDNSFLISIPEISGILESEKLPYNPIFSFTLDGTNENIQLSNFQYKDNVSPLLGELNFNLEKSGYVSVLANLRSRNSESIYINSQFSKDFKNLNLELELKEINLSRLQLYGLSGKSNLHLSILESNGVFTGNGNINSKEFIYNTDLGGIDLDFKLTQNLLSIINLKGFYNSIEYSLPLLTYNFKNGDILGQIKTEMISGDLNLKSDVAIDFSVSPIDSIFYINRELLYEYNGKVTLSRLINGNDVILENRAFRIFNNRSAFQLYSFDKNLKFLYSHVTGLTNLKITKPYYTQLSLTGFIKDKIINLSINDIDIDAGVVKYVLPNIITLDSLKLRGELSVNGSYSNPIINGLLWSDSDFGVEYIPDKIVPTRLNIRVVDSNFSILPSNINLVSGGQAQISGEFVLNGWKLDSVLVNTTVDKLKKIPVVYKYDRIITAMNVYTPKLIYFWDNSGSLITGDILVDDGEFYTQVLSTQPKPEPSDSRNAGLEVGVNVKLGANNKLYWPTKSFPVVNATVKPGDNIKVNYKSITGDFNVLGNISIISGEVDYSGKPFILKEGGVSLDLSKNHIDPYIKIVGSKTVIDDNDRQVEVLLDFEGGFFSDFKPTFSSSDASKTPDDIKALVGLAVIGDSMIELGADIVDEILTSYLTASVEEGLKEIIGVDDVKIKSGFISNLLTNSLNITNNSFDTDTESVYNLSEMLNNTSLTLGNFVTDDFFIKGRISSIYEKNRLNLGVDLGLTLYTPHFQLGFSMEPKLSESYVFEPEIGLSLEWVFNPEKGISKEN